MVPDRSHVGFYSVHIPVHSYTVHFAADGEPGIDLEIAEAVSGIVGLCPNLNFLLFEIKRKNVCPKHLNRIFF